MTLSVTDLKAKLPADLVKNTPAERVSQVLAAERAHQASVVHSPSPRPAELDSALLARVRFNLENADPDADVTRLGGTSPEVRELEAPFARRVRAAARGELALATEAPPARPAKKATTKAPAKKAAARKRTGAKKAPAKKAAPASNEGK